MQINEQPMQTDVRPMTPIGFQRFLGTSFGLRMEKHRKPSLRLPQKNKSLPGPVLSFLSFAIEIRLIPVRICSGLPQSKYKN